jgi:hypothetical protein
MPANPTPQAPAAADANYDGFAGLTLNDPDDFAASNADRTDAKYFYKPVQDEILHVITKLLLKPTAKTATYDITDDKTDAWVLFTNDGASGAASARPFNLPVISEAAPWKHGPFFFLDVDGDGIRVVAQDDKKIKHADLETVANGYIESKNTGALLMVIAAEGAWWAVPLVPDWDLETS